MSSPAVDVRLPRRPINVAFGTVVGLICGPLLGCLLNQLPRSEWLGDDNTYPETCNIVMLVIGLLCGPPVGTVVALCAWAIQRGMWGRGGMSLPKPDGAPSQPPAERTGPSDHISKRTDVTGD
jgi:hypothetical protein